VTLAGVENSSSLAVISFELSNGTYSFAASATGYSASPTNGSVLIAGYNSLEAVQFSPTSGAASGGPPWLEIALGSLAAAIAVGVAVVVLARREQPVEEPGPPEAEELDAEPDVVVVPPR